MCPANKSSIFHDTQIIGMKKAVIIGKNHCFLPDRIRFIHARM